MKRLCRTTQHHIPEDVKAQQHFCENLRYHEYVVVIGLAWDCSYLW